MTVDLDDDLLVRMLKLDAMLDCPLGMTEHDLRLVKNQLVGDSYRKKQFVLGPGLSKLLNIAKVNCTESKQHLLGHILIIIALVASNQQAIIQVIDSEFSQILTFVIRSARSHFGNVLPALQILKRIVVVKPDIDLPFPELVELAQSRSKAVSEICFEIFSRSSKAQIQSDSQTLISICYSALPYARDALPYLEFINVFFTWQFPWDPILFPTTVFFDLQDHENEACRLKAVICIIRVPSLYASNISDFPRLLRTGFRTLMDLFTRKFIINFDECCRALTQLLDAYPSFSSEASSVVAVLLSNITVDSLRALTILAESSENLREIISAKLDSAFVRLWLTKQNKVHILCANLIRSVSRSLHPTRLKLQKLGVVQILLKELTIVCSMCTESMSDIEISDKSLEGDNLHYVVTLVSALANFLLGFISMPRIDMSEGQLSLLVRLIRSEQNSVRESVCLALKNSCFNACFQRISEVTNVISISDIELLLDDTSEIVRFHSLGLLRNILLPETNRLFDSAAISKLSTRISYFLVSENPQLVLEAILALVNIAAGFRDRKVLLLCLIDVIKAVLGLLDHSWAEIRLASVIFFENLFSRACIFKKKRMILEVPIDKLIALDFTRILTIVQEREQSMGNHDTGARCSRAAVGAQTSLNVIQELLQES